MSDKDKKIESTQVYELGFHLVPTLGDDTVGKAFDEVKNLIEKVGGNVVSQSEPALLNLEYTMEKTVDSVKSKYNTAYFSWIIFVGGDVEKLSESLEYNKNVLRHLLIKTEQKDSISSQEVAKIVNGEEENTVEIKESVEEEVEKISEEEKSEETDESLEKSKEQDEASKVDEAIDELVK